MIVWGWVRWLGGVACCAILRGVMLQPLKSNVPAFSGGFLEIFSNLVVISVLCFVIYIGGLKFVGVIIIVLGVLGFIPFANLCSLAIPKFQFSRLSEGSFNEIKWKLFLRTFFWNLNYWDGATNILDEVVNPTTILPKATMFSMFLVPFDYGIPLLLMFGAVSVQEWTTQGYYSLAMIIGGNSLGLLIYITNYISTISMFLTVLSRCSFQLHGMAERGYLPKVFSSRSVHGTPTVAFIFSAVAVFFFSLLDTINVIFSAIILLYCVSSITVCISFLVLRV